MCDLGIHSENFNPRIFYIYKRKVNYSINPHTHDFIELRYVLAGSCTYMIGDALYTVKPGDLLIFNPNILHKNVFIQGEETTEFHAGFINLHIRNLPKNHLLDPSACPVISLVKYRQEILKCCYEILLEQEKSEVGSDLILKALFMKLLVFILRELCLETPLSENERCSFESSNKTIIVNTIISFINENYMKKISLDKISQNMYLSPVYISKIFKEETGESPINYLIQVRLEKAKEILEKRQLSIKEIAKAVGYDDAYHFSKLFKKYYGIPPSKYTP